MNEKIFQTVKYALVVVNLLFVLTGIIVIAVGATVQSAYRDYHPFLAERFSSLPAFLIATGIIIFLIAFLGFYGAFTENYYAIMMYVGAMVLIFIFQFSACVAGYALRSNAVAIVHQNLRDSMSLYPENVEVTKLWDEMQRDFECCGVQGHGDWNSTLSEGIPVTCCPFRYGTINEFTCESPNIYPTGCGDAFGVWVQNHARAIGVAGIFLVLMQGVTVGGAIYVGRMSRASQI